MAVHEARTRLCPLPSSLSPLAKTRSGDPASQTATAPSANGAPYTSLGQTGSPASLLAGVDRPRKQAAPQALPLCRRLERSPKGEATELPSSTPPQPSLDTTCTRGRPQNLVKPLNHLNQTKQREKSLHINSTQLSIIEIELKVRTNLGAPFMTTRLISAWVGFNVRGGTTKTAATCTFQRFSTQNLWNQYFAAAFRRKPHILKIRQPTG